MRRFVTTILPTSAAIFMAASSASAQQFQNQAGAIPGANRWTEGTECADVDNDGDLDIFFADGEGFSSPGTQRRMTLVINQLEIAAGQYIDDTVARLGTNLNHGRGVATGDVNGDGWVDALVANGFNNARPSLYTNRGADPVPMPGFFTKTDSASGFDEILNSAGAGLGDLDNDGDLDAIVLHSGASYLGGTGGRPRLYFNDGAGMFTVNEAALGAVLKKAQMDVQFVDIDNDWDLDFFGPCRSNNTGGNHYLMLNDGNGNFSDVSSLIPATSSQVYEAEVGDLDGDNDIDMFLLSSNGFAEGHIRNNIVGTGSLTFTKGTTFGSGDDNEVALIDYDNDGDFDAFVGSLTNTERLFRNNGNLTWTAVSGSVQSINDSTLDCTVADLDNDGDYDLVTAQGESNSAQWNNKVYLNTGSKDTLAPVIAREEALSGLPDANGPWVVRAQIRDQVMDDGKTWVSAQAEYTVLSTAQTLVVDLNDGPIADVTIKAGTTVTWDNSTGASSHTLTGLSDHYRFASGAVAPGASFSHTFVKPGNYSYRQAGTGPDATGNLLVVGATTTVDATDSGGGIFRFAMLDTDAGAGVKLVYELQFTDWVGNSSTSTPVSATLIDCGWVQYDVGAAPANSVDLDGAGSADPGMLFSAVATNVTGVITIYGVGLATDNYPLLGGIGLIDPGSILKFKVRPVNAGSSTWTIPLPISGSGVGGVTVYFQSSSFVSSLPDVWEHSNGLALTLCP